MNWKLYAIEIIISVVLVTVSIIVGLNLLNIDGRIKNLTVELNSHVDEIDRKTKRLESLLGDIESNITGLVKDLEDGVIDLEEYNQRIDEQRRNRNDGL